MTIAYNWTISTTNYDVATGFINCAHWNCTATDGEYSASVYSTCSFTKPEENVDLTPYDDVTEQDVLGWCWSDGVDKSATEAALAQNIELQKHPVQAAGVPWGNV
jgi:hypothetical protein